MRQWVLLAWIDIIRAGIGFRFQEDLCWEVAADATVNKSVTVTGGIPGQPGNPFGLDNTHFDFNVINKTVNLNDIEKWTITNSNVFGHAFHIHDVEFKILTIF